MVEGNAVITFGDDSTFMIGGSGTCNDKPAVVLNFRSREPGPGSEAEIKAAIEDDNTIDSSKFNVVMLFKSIESIDTLIENLNITRYELSKLLENKDD
jgi:hypothetical protein